MINFKRQDQMINTPFYNVNSEVGKLESVLLHRPGKELERLTPQYLEELLFDDIPWLGRMQEEHDMFADALRQRGCKVYYYDKLLEEILKDANVKKELVQELVVFSGIDRLKEKDAILEHLLSRSPSALTEILIAGLHKSEISYREDHRSLSYYIADDYPFYINPLPNLYFTRDPGSVIGNGISINSMKTFARSREPMILSFINRFHREINTGDIPQWYDYHQSESIEGGDILVLSKTVLAIGCSARTSAVAIEKIAENLFRSGSSIEEILVIQIPFKRAYMHLDTVFTMIDRDKFTIFPGIEGDIKVFSLKNPSRKEGGLKISHRGDLNKALSKALKLNQVLIIPSGGGDKITAAREQWNDSTNTLAISPGTVVTYRRNTASNDSLRKNGVEVVEIEGSELVRGRGGPRCMSMPLKRNDIE
ncbi:arginine deiminase [Oceanispirochaeta sp.]|jgi:arginine deiminase|uniref:arginine deiminase n=1 Tax=Oceanispirochaeta sp. TaxID=2035350 RepID=UPI0026337D12|nr:arginine deiminase [Oceanispirochaeta sp.]MDA3957855.1 arginine deiminase [Oceanispirochaeta sp.]